jgi:CBS domain-containing protein
MSYPLVRDIMDRSFVRLKPEMNVYDAIGILLQRGLTGAAVVDDDGLVIGILSERDCLKLLLRGAYERLPPGRVEDYMTREVRTVSSDTDLFALADYFTQNIYRRLLVVDHGCLVGQVTRRDLLRAIHRAVGKDKPSHPSRARIGPS